MTEHQWRTRWDCSRMFLTADGESGKAGGSSPGPRPAPPPWPPSSRAPRCRLLNDRGATLMGWIEYLATRFRCDHKSLAALRWRGRSVVAASRRGCTSRAKDSAAPGV
jgi:hypothetical protein